MCETPPGVDGFARDEMTIAVFGLMSTHEFTAITDRVKACIWTPSDMRRLLLELARTRWLLALGSDDEAGKDGAAGGPHVEGCWRWHHKCAVNLVLLLADAYRRNIAAASRR